MNRRIGSGCGGARSPRSRIQGSAGVGRAVEEGQGFHAPGGRCHAGESYDFKPHLDMRSYGELIEHIAANNALLHRAIPRW